MASRCCGVKRGGGFSDIEKSRCRHWTKQGEFCWQHLGGDRYDSFQNRDACRMNVAIMVVLAKTSPWVDLVKSETYPVELSGAAR